jgi:hypothetical protein
MNFLRRIFGGSSDDYERALRAAETRLAAYDRQLRKELKTWAEASAKRPRELARAREGCKRRLLLLYSWALVDALESFYRSSALLVRRTRLRALLDEAAAGALAGQLHATQAWRQHLTRLADERVKAAASGAPLPLPPPRTSGEAATVEGHLPIDVGAFCAPPEEVVRTAPAVKRLQKRIARITTALTESDAAIRASLPSLRPPRGEVRRAGLVAATEAEGREEVAEALAEGDTTDALAALAAALTSAAGGRTGRTAAEDAAAVALAGRVVHPSAPWLLAAMVHSYWQKTPAAAEKRDQAGPESASTPSSAAAPTRPAADSTLHHARGHSAFGGESRGRTGGSFGGCDAGPAGAPNPFEGGVVDGGGTARGRSRTQSLAAPALTAVPSASEAALLARASTRPPLEWAVARGLLHGTLTEAAEGGGMGPDAVAVAALLVHESTRTAVSTLARLLLGASERRRASEARVRSLTPIVCDQRTGEGRLLQRWCDRVLAAGCSGAYAYDLPRYMSFDPGPSWVAAERVALGLRPDGFPSLASLGLAEGGNGAPLIVAPGDRAPELILADGIDDTGAAIPTSPIRTQIQLGDWLQAAAPAATPAAAGAAQPRAPPTAGAAVAGGVPTARLVNAFLGHLTRDVASNAGLLGGAAPTGPATSTSAVPAPISSAAADSETLRLLRRLVNRIAYPRLHALLYTGLDIVPASPVGPEAEAAAEAAEAAQVGGSGSSSATSSVLSPAGSVRPPMLPPPGPGGLRSLPLAHTRSVAADLTMTTGSPGPPPLPASGEEEVGASGGAGAYTWIPTRPLRLAGSAADVMQRRDRIWGRKQAAAALLSPSALDVPPHFLTPLPHEPPSLGPPFAVARALLEACDRLTSPMAVGEAMAAAVDALVAEATARGVAANPAKPVLVTAEDLIPLLIFASSRASAWRRPHAALAFASNFAAPPGSSGGKTAYLIAVLQSAVSWVCSRPAPRAPIASVMLSRPPAATFDGPTLAFDTFTLRERPAGAEGGEEGGEEYAAFARDAEETRRRAAEASQEVDGQEGVTVEAFATAAEEEFDREYEELLADSGGDLLLLPSGLVTGGEGGGAGKETGGGADLRALIADSDAIEGALAALW